MCALWRKCVLSAAVCSAAGVCPAEEALVAIPEKAMTDECTLCETITGFVQTYLYANKTQQEIQDALDVLCSLLPDAGQCTTMVDNYLAAIYMFLRYLLTYMLLRPTMILISAGLHHCRSFANPHLVCAEIRLCPQFMADNKIHIN